MSTFEGDHHLSIPVKFEDLMVAFRKYLELSKISFPIVLLLASVTSVYKNAKKQKKKTFVTNK